MSQYSVMKRATVTVHMDGQTPSVESEPSLFVFAMRPNALHTGSFRRTSGQCGVTEKRAKRKGTIA